ncbi:MAG: potassium/proton antiporter [Gemmatimonadaceae bacterium]|jgi:cell volume regulation protein A|nr:potassium/proton antiporter [Gemmatimonadaceae bacterium]
MLETITTTSAITVALFGLLLLLSVLSSRAAERTGLPLSLLFLGVGMLAGSEGLGGVVFEDYSLAYRLGSIALALILFDGGLNTPVTTVRRVFWPASVLATLGVLITAALLAGGSYLLGLPLPIALLVGAVVSSTDAAAVFAVLRGAGINLRKRVGLTLELESGLNDPLAIILTLTVADWVVRGGSITAADVALDVIAQTAIGGGLGAGLGLLASLVLPRLQLRAAGLYPAFTLAVACLAYAVPTVLGGSGFLAVYAAGLAIGHGTVPFRASVVRVHDAVAWLAQIVMFLLLGLLVFPSRLLAAAPVGFAVALVLAFVARPVAVALCLLPFRYQPREIGYIGWVGLKGAVPIILATAPILAGVPNAHQVFDVVFFVVVVSAVLQGMSVPWLTRRLDLETSDAPPPPAVLNVEAREQFSSELHSYYVDDMLPVAGARLADLPLPATTSVMLIVRARDLIAPRGDAQLLPGDHVYLISHPDDGAQIQLLFGRAEGE